MKKYENCVYRFINKNDEIIYVGKAKSLRSRVGLKGHQSKHLPAVCYSEISCIQFIELDTAIDMSIAEIYFISKFKPTYNTMFSSVSVTLNIGSLDNLEWKILKKETKPKIQRIKRESTGPKIVAISFKENERELELFNWIRGSENMGKYIKELMRTAMNKEKLHR